MILYELKTIMTTKIFDLRPNKNTKLVTLSIFFSYIKMYTICVLVIRLMFLNEFKSTVTTLKSLNKKFTTKN